MQIDKFMEREGINTMNSINSSQDVDEPYFSHSGCEVCSTGLGNNVYDCHGYNPTTKKIQAGYRVCFDCLYEYEYGERPE
jgi:hypothetical protein